MKKRLTLLAILASLVSTSVLLASDLKPTAEFKDNQLDAYSERIYEQDMRMVERVKLRLRLARAYEDSECVQRELVNIEKEVQQAKEKYGQQLDAYSEKILREDLEIIARVKARTCLYLE